MSPSTEQQEYIVGDKEPSWKRAKASFRFPEKRLGNVEEHMEDFYQQMRDSADTRKVLC